MLYLYIIKFLFICSYTASAVQHISPHIINKNVHRNIDLTSQLVIIGSTITIENTGKDIVRNYLIALESNYNGTLSFFRGKPSADSSEKNKEYKYTKVEIAHQKGTFYNILISPIESGHTGTVYVEQIFTDALLPYPSSISQKEKQLVRYFGNHYFYSPYLTSKQTTTVELASRNIENYTKLKPEYFTQNDNTIHYGPYSNIQPYAMDQMVVHFENNSPFLKVTSMKRIIEVSHWGNIAIEENIEIYHTGAKLKGPFSRYDYQRDTSSSHNSIKSYRTILPGSAHNIYYRDSNGNISTSTVKTRKDWIELELRPRFPLFGGWQSSYTLGYSIPSYQYLFKKTDGSFVLTMKLLDHIFNYMVVEDLETLIILPVGVTDVNIKTPYDVERLPDDITYKYLDYLGRTVLKLYKTNLVEWHCQDFEITYNWHSHMMLHEPILVALALFLLFVVVIIYVRLDFSIYKHEYNKRE